MNLVSQHTAYPFIFVNLPLNLNGFEKSEEL